MKRIARTEMKKRVMKLLVLLLTATSFALGLVVHCAFHQCEIMPVADRQRVFFKLGYLPYDGIDGICGEKTHFAQRLYEHDWEAVKEWNARQK